MTNGARFPQWQASGLRMYLYQIRKEQDVTIEALAKDMGYSKSAIYSWERGYVAPSTIELMTWCEALGYQLCVAPVGAKRDKHRKQEIEMQLNLEGVK